MARDRLSEFKFGTGDVLKRIGTVRHRAASSCNAFAIVTFSSYLYFETNMKLCKFNKIEWQIVIWLCHTGCMHCVLHCVCLAACPAESHSHIAGLLTLPIFAEASQFWGPCYDCTIWQCKRPIFHTQVAPVNSDAKLFWFGRQLSAVGDGRPTSSPAVVALPPPLLPHALTSEV